MYRTGDLGRWRGGRPAGGQRAGRPPAQAARLPRRARRDRERAGRPPGHRAGGGGGHRAGPGDTRLAAYYTLRDPGGPAPTAASLRRFRARLPATWFPPCSLRARALPPDAAAASPGTAVRRRGPAPADAGRVAYLWSRLLKTEQVGLDDDFFALGGNSLLAAEMLAHARVMFGIGCGLRAPAHPVPAARSDAARVRAGHPGARAGQLAADGEPGRVDFAREAELGFPSRGPPVRAAPAVPATGLAADPRDPAHRGDRIPRGAPAQRAAGRHRRTGLVPGPGA